jgi:transcriptional regulator with XRE-family HTH domain
MCEGCERDGTGELADRDAATLARAAGCDDAALQARLFLELSDERERGAARCEVDGDLGTLGQDLIVGARRTRQPPTDWAGWGHLILRPTRERLGLSRQTLARKARVGANAILCLEQGKTRRPTLRFLRSVCNALDLPLPGDEGLYLSLDGVAADRLRRLVATALYEFARRRRDAAHFATMIHLPSDATQLCIATATVTAERDLAADLLGLLCPDLDETDLYPPTPRTPRPRRAAMPSHRPRRIHRPTRPHA